MTHSNQYPTEAQEQKTIIAYFSHNWVGQYLIHIPNGGSRSSAREGANLKAMGVRAGVSDLFLAYPSGWLDRGDYNSVEYCGLWLELKRQVSAYASEAAAYKLVTDKQRDWLELMENKGYRSEVAYGADHAIKIIEAYTGTTPM